MGVGESAWLPTDVVYSAMHGVGCEHVERAFAAFQLPPPLVVVAQAEPDPEFPTVEFPNPEEGGTAWTLALQVRWMGLPIIQLPVFSASRSDFVCGFGQRTVSDPRWSRQLRVGSARKCVQEIRVHLRSRLL